MISQLLLIIVFAWAMPVTNNIYEQVYNLEEDEALSSRVAYIVCVLMQRGLSIMGLSGGSEVLTIHYYGYNINKPVWDIAFFEHIFATEPLLAAREKMKGIFFSGSSNLIIPDELFAENEAAAWLGRIHFTEPGDRVRIFPLHNDKAQYATAIPLNITELVAINFKKTRLLPLAAYQFTADHSQGLYLQCCLSNDQVVATLHNYSQLLWHHVFSYSGAEDIAYEIMNLCRENYIDTTKLSIACNAITAQQLPVINELTQYFHTLKAGNGLSILTPWDPAVSLATQLLACVS